LMESASTPHKIKKFDPEEHGLEKGFRLTDYTKLKG